MPKPPGKCIFCGKGNMTKEHIWPEWFGSTLTKRLPVYYNIKMRVGYEGDKQVTKLRVFETRPGDPTTRKVRRVCKSCNSGWMGLLQSRAKPILLPMMNRQNFTLYQSAQSVVAAWIAMTTMCADADDPVSSVISSPERIWMMEQGAPPPNWYIWLGRFQGEMWANRFRHHGITSLRAIAARQSGALPVVVDGGAAHDSQVTTLTAGELLVQAFSSILPLTDFDYLRYAGYLGLRSIWPGSGQDITWGELPVLSDVDAETIANALQDGPPA